MTTLRPYQQRVIDQLYGWWVAHPDITAAPILELPTGAGKSIVIAELVRLLFDTWPEDHPRTVVLVPSKELAEQNAEKLRAMLPARISVGFYSASLGRKDAMADVIVATIGSIYKHAHRLGNIKCVLIDECHLVNPDGAEAGRYRQFLADLAQLCTFRVAGCTATPFRGNGVWLTEGDAPLFTGIAAKVAVQELLDAGFLAPLVRPVDAIATRIDVEGVRVTSGDYKLDELDERVSNYLPAAVAETMTLAADRKKWIAFTPTVATANQLAELLTQAGALSAVVTGETPNAERADLIAAFRAGRLRCLVTVVALATGFDVPDVDCVIWLRPTKSPVLYVQGAGRGLRIAPGKTDCLWLDFSDTTERLGPVDAIKGRAKKEKVEADAPYRMCPECAAQVRPAAACACPFCGYEFPPPEAPAARNASNAAVMSHQVAPKINTYDVSRVSYGIHKKDGKPDSLKVTYWSGMRVIASEWVCFEHTGFARAKAEAWFIKRRPAGFTAIPGSVAQFFDWHGSGFQLAEPVAIKVDESARYPEVIGYQFFVQEAA